MQMDLVRVSRGFVYLQRLKPLPRLYTVKAIFPIDFSISFARGIQAPACTACALYINPSSVVCFNFFLTRVSASFLSRLSCSLRIALAAADNARMSYWVG